MKYELTYEALQEIDLNARLMRAEAFASLVRKAVALIKAPLRLAGLQAA